MSINLLNAVHTKFLNGLKPKLIIFFENIDDTLFDLANKADTNAKQTLYFESMTLIRKSRQQISNRFFNSMNESLNSLINLTKDHLGNLIDSVATTQQPKVIELVDDNELDEKLAKTNLISKSDMAYHSYLFALSLRVSNILDSNKIKNEQISISPYQLVNAFSNSLSDIKIETNPKLILFKVFERLIMGQLSELYITANKTLAEAGIIPDIKYNINSTKSDPSKKPIEESPNDETEIKSTPANNLTENTSFNQVDNRFPSLPQEQIDSNYQLISQLFQNNVNANNNSQNSNQFSSSNQGVNPANSVSNHQPLDLNSLVSSLSELQKALSQQSFASTENKSPIEIKDMLMDQLNKSEFKDKKIQQKDSDTVDLVGMLFQFIVDDRDLPNPIQVIIARLQIPYMKIALYDRNVFADKKHPARLLLDDLSLESVGWSEESDPKSEYKNKVTDVVNEILELDEYENSYFEKLKSDFNTFVQKSKRKTEVLQRRTIEKRLGIEKSIESNQETAKLLLDKMKNKRMPLSIRHLLLGDWSKIIVLTQLRHDKDSFEYRDKIDFIDKLLKFIQPSRLKSNKSLIIKSLLQQYKSGLELIIFGTQEIIEKQKALLSCFTEIHKLDPESKELDNITKLVTPKNITEPVEENESPYEIGEFIEQIIEHEENPIEQKIFDDIFSNMVKQLKIGTWFEFYNIKGKDIKVKLSWVSPITGKHLFVNSRGLKFTNETKEHLAELLREKAARILRNEPLFDRALSSIADQLKNNQEKTA
jgi:hypothetical protein